MEKKTTIGTLARRIRELKLELRTERSRTVHELIERDSTAGWYAKPYVLRDMLQGKRISEMSRLYTQIKALKGEPIGNRDFKSSPEFVLCKDVFTMFEYMILNAPRVMDALMEMEIRAMRGDLAVLKAEHEKAAPEKNRPAAAL